MMNENNLRPTELYEWTLNNLHTFSNDVQDTILQNLQQLKWIPDMLETLSPYQREIFKLTLLTKMEDDSFPFCPMSITCIMHNLKRYGIDITDLENLMNTSEKIRSRMEELITKLFCNR